MIDLSAVRQSIAAVLSPGCFYASLPLRLEWEHLSADDTPWEVSRGCLFARHLSRATAIFETWNVWLLQDSERSGEPLLSLKLDSEHGQLHVVRGIWCWTWEGYQAEDNVFLSREVPRWVRELVGTVDIGPDSGESLQANLAWWVFRAVVGLSRLPLTSVEAPLPGFSLGELAYFYHPSRLATDPLTSWPELLAHYHDQWPSEVRTKWLEFLLRCAPASAVGDAATAFAKRWLDKGRSTADAVALLRAVFNEVALSPYTDFVDKTLAFLRQLVEKAFLTAQQHVDFLGWLLRQLARHLTAYDLITFHHRGANYPDALLLDSALKEFLRLLELYPALFEGDDRPARLRRRALRLAWLHRRRYEGHAVPDAPTSPGENMRILPPPFERVPEEQIFNPGKRQKRLYYGDPLPNHVGPHGQRVQEQCGRDLQDVHELRELGMAIFIERPLGAGKAPGEPDFSPLLAHEGYSRSLAERALGELQREPLFALSANDAAVCRGLLAQPWPTGGIPAHTLPTEPPRVVSLADAAKAAGDFVILRTLPASVRAFAPGPKRRHCCGSGKSIWTKRATG